MYDFSTGCGFITGPQIKPSVALSLKKEEKLQDKNKS